MRVSDSLGNQRRKRKRRRPPNALFLMHLSEMSAACDVHIHTACICNATERKSINHCDRMRWSTHFDRCRRCRFAGRHTAATFIRHCRRKKIDTSVNGCEREASAHNPNYVITCVIYYHDTITEGMEDTFVFAQVSYVLGFS